MKQIVFAIAIIFTGALSCVLHADEALSVFEQHKVLDRKERRAFLEKLTAEKMDQFILETVREQSQGLTPDRIRKGWRLLTMLTGGHFEKWGEKLLTEENPLTVKIILALFNDPKRDLAWKVAFHGYLKVIFMQSTNLNTYEITLSKDDIETLRKTISDITILSPNKLY